MLRDGWKRTDRLGTLTGKSGTRYVLIGVEGNCDACGTPFGVRAAVKSDEAWPRPRVRFVHDADAAGDDAPRHHLEMTGESEAARALRDGTVIATSAERLTDDRRN